jgi:hypothetical protein
VSVERYTAVFTGLLSMKRPGEYPYLSMGKEPLGRGGSAMRRGQPPCERMGREIPFIDLPEDCKRLVLNIYRGLWGVEESDAPSSIPAATVGPDRSEALRRSD